MTAFQNYFIKSNYQERIFEVNEKIINSSVLLKNIFELTETNPYIPIGVDCSENSLRIFIKLLQIQEENANDEEKYNLEVIKLFKDFSEDALADFIQESCILDSDVLLDALADVILNNMKEMSREEINEYLEIEDDFTAAERQWQTKNIFEYFISLEDPNFPFHFPLPCSQSFYSIKTKFSSPLNILLSKICQRSDESLALRLSLCSKALKNECDRSPIKVSQIIMTYYGWFFDITKDKIEWKIWVKPENEKYFAAICKRRAMAWNDNLEISYCHSSTFSETNFNFHKKYSLSLDWLIPHKNIRTIEVSISDFEIYVSNFDLSKFHFSHILFDVTFNDGIDFDLVYNSLIAKDLSKEVELYMFNFSQRKIGIRASKKPNAARFARCLCHFKDLKNPIPSSFKAFATKYMEYDGRLEFPVRHPAIPEEITQTCSVTPIFKYCFMHDLLKYL